MPRSVVITAARPGRKPSSTSPNATRKRAAYADRTARGRCVHHEKRKAVSGISCQECRDSNVEAQRRLAAYRLSNGLCRECGEPRGPDETRCAKCRRKRRQRPSRQHAYRLKYERGYGNRKR